MSNPEDHLEPFLAKVRERFRPAENLESFWDCETLLKEFGSGPWLQLMINQELERLVKSAALQLDDWLPNEWVMHRGGGTILSLTQLTASRRYVHALPFLGHYLVMGTEALHYDLYRLPEEYRNAVFDPRLKLEAAGNFTVEPGSVLRLDSRRYAYDFRVEKPVLMLKFVTSPVLALEWLFTKNNLQAWQANDADLSFTQMRVAADVLGRLAHQSSAPYLKQLANYPHHAVRWAAIRNLARVDRAEALVLIQRAVNDPHPHVRQAAQKTLAQAQKKT